MITLHVHTRGETIYQYIDIAIAMFTTAIQYNMANREYRYNAYCNILQYIAIYCNIMQYIAILIVTSCKHVLDIVFLAG